MSGSELQLVIRHQALQLQIHDPILDDFYHHFWVIKGGTSKAKPLLSKPAMISTERKKMDDEAVGASLGVGAVHHRTPDVAIRTPRKLLEVGSAIPSAGAKLAAEQIADSHAAEGGDGSGDGSGGGIPLSSRRWVTRASIHQARETLIELRVHASSSAVVTPDGQLMRNTLLQRLHALVHHLPNGSAPGAAIGPLNIHLFNCEKGRKLIADLLPLWPPVVVCATLHSFLDQLPLCLASQTLPLADVPALASSLASLPKSLTPNQSASLLEASTSHGLVALRSALERSDVTALLLGLLCCPSIAETCPLALTSFYDALFPAASLSEAPWALLNALLPVATAAHSNLLLDATTALDMETLTPPCKAAHAAFDTRLRSHMTSLG